MPHAHVITMNDGVEAVCLGTEAEAEAVRDRLKAAWVASWRRTGCRLPFVYWAVRTVEVLE
jgi:hypothetical protein